MLVTFLYHRIKNGKHANTAQDITNHFEYLAKNYKIVLPGEKINLFKTNLCLTFDDGYFDFYYFIYPLLKRFNIKAQLAVSVKFIEESSLLDPKVRLSDTNLNNASFCSWKELKEMSDSGLVSIASHSYSHKNLLEKDTDLNLEIIQSKKILEEKLKKEISTFVYPYGKFNKTIHDITLKHYRYSMRIGSTFNFSWQNLNNICYRIISDNLKSKKENLKALAFISYIWFYLLNTFRGR